MPALNPYVSQMARPTSPTMPYGRSLAALRYHPPAAYTGPTESTSGYTQAGQEQGKQDELARQQQAGQVNAGMNAARQTASTQFDQDQAKDTAAYRAANANSAGAVANRETTQEARDHGIDPSSDAATVASAASGPYRVGADGRIAGGDTGNESVAPNEADVRNAITTQMAAKDGTQNANQANAYANAGAAVNGQQPTGASPFTPLAQRAPATALRPPDADAGTFQSPALSGGSAASPLQTQPAPLTPVRPSLAPAARTVLTPAQPAMPSTINSAFNANRRRQTQPQTALVTP